MTQGSSSKAPPSLPRLVLASGSPRRYALLQQIGLTPDLVVPAQVDETPRRGEKARQVAVRLAKAKAEAAAHALTRQGAGEVYLVAADTVVSVGGRLLPKTELIEDAGQCLRLLSGRSHRVHTGLVVMTPSGAVRQRLVETRVRFKRLSPIEIDTYLGSGEWKGKAGGYAIQGIAGAFVVKIVGSYSAVVGLPLYETAALLAGERFPVPFYWLNR